jgi:PAS domain-containing protein
VRGATSPALALWNSSSGQLEYFNEAFAERIGWSREQLLSQGLHWTTLVEGNAEAEASARRWLAQDPVRGACCFTLRLRHSHAVLPDSTTSSEQHCSRGRPVELRCTLHWIRNDTIACLLN